MIIYTCPECGHDLMNEVLTCNPPIHEYYCPNCGWRHHDREEVVRIPFGGNGLAMKSLVMREATDEEAKKVYDKYYKIQNKNPYTKYSYNSGLITEDGKRIWGIDSDWLMFEIKHGNGFPPLD